MKKKADYIYAFILLFFTWQIISSLLNKAILPTPIDIFLNIYAIFWNKITIHILYSIRRITIGILIALSGGVAVGILMGYIEQTDRFFSPIIYFSYPIPKIALLPIVMLLFGLGEVAKLIMIFLINFFPITVNIRDYVKNMPEEIFYPAYSLGATHSQIIREIIIPGSIPVALTSLRLGLGTAISVLFFTENFGTEYGLGYFIMDAWMRVNYIEMYSGILVLSIIGLILFIIIDIFENILCPWRVNR